MASYSEARAALVAHLRAGYAAMTIYADPTTELTTEDEAVGWVEIAWDPGTKGPIGGRLGPNLTQYDSPFSYTLRIMVPRLAAGDTAAWAAAWAAAVALEALALESQVGDLYTEDTHARPQELEDGDTHIQIDLICTGFLESVK